MGEKLVPLHGCLYGSADRRDRVLFEYHAFSAIACVSIACILLGSNKLQRVYLPLFYAVNSAVMLQILSSSLFFWSYPYSETEGNCAEIFVGRLHCLFVAFGELHQVYFIANVLGLQRLRFHFPFANALSLEAALR